MRSGAGALGALLVAASAQASVVLEVGGSAEREGGAVVARVELRNVGDAPALELKVTGELLGETAEATVPTLPAGGAGQAVLRYGVEPPRPGVHPLVLLFEYVSGSPGTASPPLNQRAYLLLALGAEGTPAVRMSVPDANLETYGLYPVILSSADGAAHRVRLRVAPPLGLRAEFPRPEVEVPAQGPVVATYTLLRAGAPRGSPQGVLFLAAPVEGDRERTSVTTGRVNVLPDPALLPRLRRPMVVVALLLLAAAVGLEVRRYRR